MIMERNENIYMSLILPLGLSIRFDDVDENFENSLKYHKVLDYNQTSYPSLREFNLNYNLSMPSNSRKFTIDLSCSTTKELIMGTNEKIVKWNIYDAKRKLVLRDKDVKYSDHTIVMSGLHQGKYCIEFLLDHGTIFTNHFTLRRNSLGLN